MPDTNYCNLAKVPSRAADHTAVETQISALL
jgi:hypothetical protein